MWKYVSIFLLPFVLFANENENPLVVGTTSGYAPFVSLNEKGEYEGFDIDLANALAAKLKRPLWIRDFGSMPGLMLALKQGKADALIWAISITEERKKSLDMIYYQGEKVSDISLIFWKTAPQGIKDFAGLPRDRIISVEAGSYQESVLNKVPKLDLNRIDRVSDAILALKYGKSWAAALDESLFPKLKAQHPELQKIKLPLPPEDVSQGNGICVNRSNRELSSQIEKAVEELRADGTLERLEKKWGLAP